MNSRIPAPHDPEDRSLFTEGKNQEQGLDKTLADSFPTSDPPSSIPDPGEEEAFGHVAAHRHLLVGLTPGSWAAIALDEEKVVGTGPTRDQAEQDANQRGFRNIELLQVPADSEAPLQAPDAA